MAKRKTSGRLFELRPVPMPDVISYQSNEIGKPFFIRLKAPKEAEKFLDDHKHYTKSNINVCYAAPRNSKSSRNWYETQLNIEKKVREQTGYPYTGVPFYVVTDDGYGFLAHTTSANNKQLAAVKNELILGRWIKGRLVSEGLVRPIDDTAADIKRTGMITEEMLAEYGCNAVVFQKTSQHISDPDYPPDTYEVWTMKLIYMSDSDG